MHATSSIIAAVLQSHGGKSNSYIYKVAEKLAHYV